MQTLRLDWPEFVKEYYKAPEAVGRSTDEVFSIDCIIYSHDWAPIYSRLIFMTAFPVIIVITIFIFWTILKCVIKRMTWD